MRPFDELPTERLSREHEDRLGKAIRKYRRQSDINRLVLHNLREAVVYTGRIAKELLDDQTLLSVCYKELYRSAKRFRPGRTRFFAFCKPGLRGAIKRNWGVYDVVKNARPQELTLADCPPMPILEFDAQGYACVEDFRTASAADGGKSRAHLEPFENFNFEGLYTSEAFSNLQKIMRARLTAQEQMILTLVYKCGLSFVAIAELLEISRPAVQTTHLAALTKLRTAVAESPQLFDRQT